MNISLADQIKCVKGLCTMLDSKFGRSVSVVFHDRDDAEKKLQAVLDTLRTLAECADKDGER